ncbi:glycoside hydrolase, family 57 [Heliomicrobium modesticaldum Ice1]|uniref:Glycoside hydrolase, family 57 n=1 Tax=Heliobacterium modesticaldum (strain ATCC 51547 / Ice1) TaxID=498761 RepID=B0TDH3_HELMI|nr:1,4-alpha-glucan branching protein domain-containing protein [Heliomicrobium modesticaldum]ABZ85498.1 glycoside hydrolase, family 57 [Heliomicrobium modesticaldum Ice1]
MTKGWIAFVLHAHLPFVRHFDREDYLEERWLFEAITECYLPLLSVFEGWQRDRLPVAITLTMSPTLLTMLADPLLQERYAKHVSKLTLLAELEIERTHDDPAFAPLARMYRDCFNDALSTFNDRYGRDLVGAFRRLMDAGILEIIPCPATHGYLPLMRPHPVAERAQIAVAVETYQDFFHRSPPGIWLSECAFHPGLEKILADFHLRYFITDAHGILYATPRPRYGLYAPLMTPAGVAAFGRDVESSKQVWSKDEGYPGDGDYREYYRDIGYDLDFEYVRPFIHPEGIRLHTGFKYHRITDREGSHKAPYVPAWAEAKAALHARNFLFNRSRQLEWLNSLMPERTPLIVCPYDAELFGHWWYEGPRFLDQVIRQQGQVNPEIAFITPTRYLDENPLIQPAMPNESSWGDAGYHEVWLENSNHWLYRHLHRAAERMIRLAQEQPFPEALPRRALNQMARELLLAQSSDWAFIMKTDTAVRYAVNRSVYHLNNCSLLYEMLRGKRALKESIIADLEERSPIFPRIDYRAYAGTGSPAH